MIALKFLNKKQQSLKLITIFNAFYTFSLSVYGYILIKYRF